MNFSGAMKLVKSCSAIAGVCTVLILLFTKNKLHIDKQLNNYPVDDEVNNYMKNFRAEGKYINSILWIT